MLYLTKVAEFSASHRLYNPGYSDEKNEDTFDKCNNINGHGHNYIIEVTVKGVPDPETGYVYDLKKLNKLIKDEILDLVDHKHLNYDVELLRGIIPTVENIAAKFWEVLAGKVEGAQLHKIRLYETSHSYVDYYGDEFDIPVYRI